MKVAKYIWDTAIEALPYLAVLFIAQQLIVAAWVLVG